MYGWKSSKVHILMEYFRTSELFQILIQISTKLSHILQSLDAKFQPDHKHLHTNLYSNVNFIFFTIHQNQSMSFQNISPHLTQNFSIVQNDDTKHILSKTWKRKLYQKRTTTYIYIYIYFFQLINSQSTSYHWQLSGQRTVEVIRLLEQSFHHSRRWVLFKHRESVWPPPVREYGKFPALPADLSNYTRGRFRAKC